MDSRKFHEDFESARRTGAMMSKAIIAMWILMLFVLLAILSGTAFVVYKLLIYFGVM